MKQWTASTPGPNLVVMAGVHGNEPCGLEAITALKDTIELTRGQLTFVVGSPAAVTAGQREYEANLNRLFRPDEMLSEEEKMTYEYRRSRELMPLLADADALLDLHSSGTADTEPFVICEPQSFKTAAHLPAAVVVSGIDTLHPTGTDAYVNQCGGQGICLECGNHTDPAASQLAETAIVSFLRSFQVVAGPRPESREQHSIRAEWIYRNRAEFVLQKQFREFESVQEGEVIGYDDGEAVRAPYDGNILFPHNRSIPGTEAFLFGR